MNRLTAIASFDEGEIVHGELKQLQAQLTSVKNVRPVDFVSESLQQSTALRITFLPYPLPNVRRVLMVGVIECLFVHKFLKLFEKSPLFSKKNLTLM